MFSLYSTLHKLHTCLKLSRASLIIIVAKRWMTTNLTKLCQLTQDKYLVLLIICTVNTLQLINKLLMGSKIHG